MWWQRHPIDMNLLTHIEHDQEQIRQAMIPHTLPNGDILRLFDTQGPGEPILCMPMATEVNFVYTPQIAEFRKDHRVILYEPQLQRYSHYGIADRAAEAEALLQSLQLESAHFISWSDTGSATYYLAKIKPNRCRSITFLAFADQYILPQPLHTLMLIYAALPIEGLVPDPVIAYLLGEFLGGPKAEPALMRKYASTVSQLSRLFKHSIVPNMLEHHPSIGEVQVPCLVLCGDRGRLVTVEHARRLAALLSQSGEAVIIPGGEHFLGYATPEAVNSSIRDFYASLTPHQSTESEYHEFG